MSASMVLPGPFWEVLWLLARVVDVGSVGLRECKVKLPQTTGHYTPK